MPIVIPTISEQIAQELDVKTAQITATLKLLDEGATVPFIARYRKEVTGGLDDTQLRLLEERLHYLRDLGKRRETILETIQEQGKLTDALHDAILQADTKSKLEDLYLPFKPKRRNKAQIAKEAGLEPLARQLLLNPSLVPETAAKTYIDSEKGIPDAETALEGAGQILMEEFSEDPELIGMLRQFLWNTGSVLSKVVKGKEEAGVKFSDYFNYDEAIRAIPSHRALALLRGRNEGFLKFSLEPATTKDDIVRATEGIKARIAKRFNIQNDNRPGSLWLQSIVSKAWQTKIHSHLEAELINRLKEQSEEEAINVFSRNLRDLLMAPPAGPKVTMGLDPGLRTGVKTAVVNATGKVVDTAIIYPHPPQNAWEQAISQLAKLAEKHQVTLISIGNGTGSRETDRLVQELIKRHPELKLQKIIVSEAGASVYSASALASKELPDMDVSLRGAVSIARRLQDPLAELVKIESKAIGVGQYQHDVNQTQLGRMLDTVVEDCVNAVGVDVNTASPALLSYISGLSQTLAHNIVDMRNQNGPFPNRDALKKVPKLGPKAFEQSAGFLRVMRGTNPLDASAVHPEAYPVVERILKTSHRDIQSVIGDVDFLRRLDPQEFTNAQFGLPTVQDIISELEKPGRDPRPEFKTATFKEGIEDIKDLIPGLLLEGVVTNITNFGAFVDIGVHQDGLVHISMMADTFVKDPHAIVKTGDVVKVKVMEIDIPRKRISLSMRLSAG